MNNFFQSRIALSPGVFLEGERLRGLSPSSRIYGKYRKGTVPSRENYPKYAKFSRVQQSNVKGSYLSAPISHCIISERSEKKFLKGSLSYHKEPFLKYFMGTPLVSL